MSALAGVTGSVISRIDGRGTATDPDDLSRPDPGVFFAAQKTQKCPDFPKFSKKTCARVENVLISGYIRKIGRAVFDLLSSDIPDLAFLNIIHLFYFIFN